MADFVIDTVGATTQEDVDNQKKDNSFLKLLFSDFNECLKTKFGVDCTTKMNVLDKSTKPIKTSPLETDVPKRNLEVIKALEKSILLDPNFESCHSLPQISKKQSLKGRKEEREKTKGIKWFNLPATEVTEDIKNDLEVLQMRSVLDPKHFYKKNDIKILPKYFQIGKVMDSPLDFYNNRLTQKERKKTLVDELLADAEFNKYNKRKYREIISEKQKTHYKAWRQAKKFKKRK